MASSIQVQIRKLPEGRIKADDFLLSEVAILPLGQGEICVRNEWMSLDPYMRLGLTRQDGFVAQLVPGDILNGPAIGVIESSRDPDFPEGAHIISQMGWRSRFVANPSEAGFKLVPSDAPLEWNLGLLGLTGITAWLGIEDVLLPERGETIFISGAAGAVGTIACQLAKRRGARVLGSAGSSGKADWLKRELGVEAVFQYREQSLEAFLQNYAPDGLDCYFDNIGGEMLESFLTLVRPGGRIGLCGAMSQYEVEDYRGGPRNFFAVIENELVLKGFNAFRLPEQKWAEYAENLKTLALNGELKAFQSVVDGIDKVPHAFAQMFDAGQCGKLVVRI